MIMDLLIDFRSDLDLIFDLDKLKFLRCLNFFQLFNLSTNEAIKFQ